MARDETFVNAIEQSFIKTMDVHATARDLKLDISLVRFWLAKRGVDLRGLNAWAYSNGVSERHSRLGATIAMLRMESGLHTAQMLAKEAGLSTRKVAAIERGERDATFSELLRIGDALQCTPAQLFQRVEMVMPDAMEE